MIEVNIYDNILNLHTKRNYSSSDRWKTVNIYNLLFFWSLSLIVDISSQGDWNYLNLILKNSNIDTFINYVDNLRYWLISGLKICKQIITLLLDNSPIIHSKNLMKCLNRLQCLMMFLASYSPEFAQAEYLFKSRLSRSNSEKTVSLNMKEGFKFITSCMITITREETTSLLVHTTWNIIASLS